jgi:putative oxidoreductase
MTTFGQTMGADARPDRPASKTPSIARRLIDRVIDTPADLGAAIARVALAVAIFPHGAQHALGWFGGYGFTGTHAWMTKTLGFPAPLAALAITTELLAPFALLLGLAGRIAALGLVGLMLGAISTHLPNGFFMNWFGALPAGQEGFEYHLLVVVLCAVVITTGSGRFSLDRGFARRRA